MAVRTDAEKIGDIIKVKPGAKLTRFIQSATVIIDRMISCASDKGFTHTAQELIEIETWLAAHFYSVFDAQYVSESAKDRSASYDHKQWFHQALMIDASGCLKALLGPEGKGAVTASLDWAGLNPSDQNAWYERD